MIKIQPCHVGVTGHRDIDSQDVQDISMALHDCFAEIETMQPDNVWWLASGLAAGADQLAAECALNRGWKLHAILAGPVDDFAKTMDERHARRLLTEFLPRSDEITVLDPHHGSNALNYSAVSDALASKCSYMVGLWDGQHSQGPGGTADTMARFIDQAVASQIERRVLYWIPTRRRTTIMALKPHQWVRLHPPKD